jgi:hypothetical protein
MQDDAEFYNLRARHGPRTPCRAARQLHEALPRTTALTRRHESTLRRRLFAIRIDRGGGAHLTPTPPQQARPSRSPPQPKRGFLDASASRTPHGNVHIDTTSRLFYAPEAKLTKIAQHARHLIGRATRNARWLPVKDLKSLACKAIPVARFFLKELHSVVGEKWGGLVR